MSITHIHSVSELSNILSKSKDKVSVIDFHATWCGPCKVIAPHFEALAVHFGQKVNFLKCDVDKAQDVARMYNVTAMPTFIFLHGNQKVHQIRGAQKRELEESVRKYAEGSSGGFTGKGQTLGGSGTSLDASRELHNAADGVMAKFFQLDPQIRILVGLLAAYLLFWYLS